jgi:hypothetical protein
MTIVSVDQQYVARSASVQNAGRGEHVITFTTVMAIAMARSTASMAHRPILHARSCMIRNSITHTDALMSRFA